MHRFVQGFVVPFMKSRGWCRLCEIGASTGASTALLLKIPHLTLTVIDPCLDCDLLQKFESNPCFDLKKGLSLEVLPTLAQTFDVILIDGDHNWYTVFNELSIIAERKLLRRGGVIFFHDVAWPWGRRDMYYQPETIPPEYRRDWNEEAIAGKRGFADRGGALARYKKATVEGGPRNGVLSAIEEFLATDPNKYRFVSVSAGAGLGIMQYRGGLRDDLAFLVLAVKAFACNVLLRGSQLPRWAAAPVSSRENSPASKAG